MAVISLKVRQFFCTALLPRRIDITHSNNKKQDRVKISFFRILKKQLPYCNHLSK